MAIVTLMNINILTYLLYYSSHIAVGKWLPLLALVLCHTTSCLLLEIVSQQYKSRKAVKGWGTSGPPTVYSFHISVNTGADKICNLDPKCLSECLITRSVGGPDARTLGVLTLGMIQNKNDLRLNWLETTQLLYGGNSKRHQPTKHGKSSSAVT